MNRQKYNKDSQSKTILVVEDDSFIRTLLDRQLSTVGYNVTTARNGLESIEFVTKNVPDLIIMDLEMPEMGGLEAIQEIRKQYNSANLPIIVLSSERSKKEWTIALKAGANDFVPKPYDKNELFARITTNLRVAFLTNMLGLKTQDLLSKNEKLAQEMSLAVNIQKTILPGVVQFQDLKVERFFHPLHQLSGDYLDIFEEDEVMTLMIGDISAKDISAALIMFAAKSILQSFGKSKKKPLEVVSRVNQLFCEMLQDSGFSFSLVFAVFNKRSNEVLFLSAGHIPVVLHSGDVLRSIKSTGPRLGINKDASWTVKKVPFFPGNSLFFCTDGLIEATDANGEKFGMDRLLVELKKNSEPKKQLFNAFSAVKEFCQSNFSDDITMLSIKRP